MKTLFAALVARGTGGHIAAMSLGYSAAIGASYLLHKTHHHSLGHVALDVAIAVEAGMTVRNSAMISR